MEYEVLKRKITSADKAFDAIATLPQPVCVVVFGDSDIKDRAYQEIIGKIKRRIAIICTSDSPWAANQMLQKGKNAILKINRDALSEPGNLHRIISGINATVSSKYGSIAGVRIKSVLHSEEPAGYSIEPDYLDCLVVVRL